MKIESPELKTAAQVSSERTFPEAEVEAFPADLGKAVQLLQTLTVEVGASRSKALAKRHRGEATANEAALTPKESRLVALRKHVHQLQLHLPVTVTTANDQAKAPGLSLSSIQSARLRSFVGANPWFKTLILDRLDKLESQLSATKQ